MVNYTFVLVLALAILCTTEGFRVSVSNPKILSIHTKNVKSFSELHMSVFTSLPSTLMVSGLAERLGIMPLCLQASSKTTTFDDPTAGMSAEEIVNYVSNVGGGMCGAPEFVRISIGLGLNFSLLFFGLFTLSYVVLSGLNFALEKTIEDSINSMDTAGPRPKGQPTLAYIAEQAGVDVKGSGPGLQASLMEAKGGPSDAMKRQQEKLLNGDLSTVLEASNAGPLTNSGDFAAGGAGKDGLNRDQRRIARRIKDKE
jgi:hypothetical protein